MTQKSFYVDTQGRGLTNISKTIQSIVSTCSPKSGLINVFIHHTSASLIITENADPDVQLDLDAYLTKLVRDGDPMYRHVDEGPDDMSAHIRSVLTATSLMIPLSNGRMDLGHWQGVFVWEHRTRAHQRRISVTVVGD